MTFAAGEEANTIWAKTGAIVSPNKNVDLSVYNAVAAMDAAQVAKANIFVFDGSDLAPPPRSAGALCSWRCKIFSQSREN
jgi:hypothetical protein